MRSTMIGTAMVLGVVLGGCQVAGGGFIPSYFDAEEKATFGFEAACVPEFTDAGDAGLVDDGGLVASGHFQYKDHGTPGRLKVQLHGIVDTAIGYPTDLPGAVGVGAGDGGGVEFCGLETTVATSTFDAGSEAVAEGFFAGTYTPQPKKDRGEPREGGYFQVYWTDGGDPPGLSDDDTIAILLIGGEFDGYYNQGALGGGNIEFEFLYED